MRRRVGIEVVNAYDLVIGTRSKPTSIRGKSDGMDCAGMIAHVA